MDQPTHVEITNRLTANTNRLAQIGLLHPVFGTEYPGVPSP